MTETPALTAPTIAPITVGREVWSLDADLDAIRVWAHVWQAHGKSTCEQSNSLNEHIKQVDTDWEGSDRDKWVELHTSLSSDVYELGAFAGRTAELLLELADALEEKQLELDEHLEAATDACLSTFDEGLSRGPLDDSIFYPETLEQANIVNANVAGARTVRISVENLGRGIVGENGFADASWNDSLMRVQHTAKVWTEKAVAKSYHGFTPGPESDSEGWRYDAPRISRDPNKFYGPGLIQNRVTVRTGPGADVVDVSTFTDDGVWKLRVVYNGKTEEFEGDGSVLGHALTIRGGSGNDRITVRNGPGLHDEFPVTVLGGAGNDVIRTDRGVDVIIAGPGVDTVDSGGGRDWVDNGEHGELKLEP